MPGDRRTLRMLARQVEPTLAAHNAAPPGSTEMLERFLVLCDGPLPTAATRERFGATVAIQLWHDAEAFEEVLRTFVAAAPDRRAELVQRLEQDIAHAATPSEAAAALQREGRFLPGTVRLQLVADVVAKFGPARTREEVAQLAAFVAPLARGLMRVEADVDALLARAATRRELASKALRLVNADASLARMQGTLDTTPWRAVLRELGGRMDNSPQMRGPADAALSDLIGLDTFAPR